MPVAEHEALEREHAGLQAIHIEEQEKSKETLAELETQLGEQAEAREALETEVEVLKQKLESATSEAEKIGAEFEAYRKKYRTGMRQKAPGREFSEIRVGGAAPKTYEAVTIREIDPARVRIFHQSGAVTLALADLEPEMQQQLGFDLDEAMAFLKAEEEAAKPEVLTKEEENQRERDRLNQERLKSMADWKRRYQKAEKIKEMMNETAARSKAVANAINRYYSRSRNLSGAQLSRVTELKRQRAQLDHRYQALKAEYRELMQ